MIARWPGTGLAIVGPFDNPLTATASVAVGVSRDRRFVGLADEEAAAAIAIGATCDGEGRM